MKYLVLLTPVAGRDLAEFAPHMVPEVKAVWAAYAQGALREIYFAQCTPPVVTLIYELPDEAAVQRQIDALPMVEAGLLDSRIIQLGPFQQFQVLFDKETVAAA